MSVDLQSFADDFLRLTGHSPMRWQQRLFERFMDGRIPAALDLPTGLGKTSVMAIWLLARALAGETAVKAIPRRLVYIVDRRAVVDQATEEAERLRDALECNDTPESKANQLKGLAPADREKAFATLRALKKKLGVGDQENLPISTLRGAYADNREWLADPAAPAILVGTIDMIGSRLLFAGYGVSRRMRPYHAGLLGADTLVVLDEAHLVPPFEALLHAIANGMETFGPGADSDRALVPTLRLLSLSATGRSEKAAETCADNETFRLKDDDLSDRVVKERLTARKTLGFIKIGDDKDALVEALARQAWRLAEGGGKPVRCLVYCDSREIAEHAKKAIESLADGNRKSGIPKIAIGVELFVGARRVKERKDAKEWLLRHGFLAGSDPPAKPAFLIATAAGEVGIDLDADHMVCDLVPWERMVQRLGRVNRRGDGDATVVVVHGDEPMAKKPDAPTDQEKRQAIGFRSLSIFDELPAIGTGRDASPGALRELKLRAEIDEALRKKIDDATTRRPVYPALTCALVDAWSMTSLERHTGRPEVAPWLRGWVEDEPQTAVVWRTHLPIREPIAEWPRTPAEKKEVETFFEAAPPHESEKLETETYRVVDWLQERAMWLHKHAAGASPKKGEDADAEPAEKGEENGSESEILPRALQPDDIVAYALSSAGDYEDRYTLRELIDDRNKRLKETLKASLKGRMLVVDARFGGLDAGMLKPESEAVFETADACGAWSHAAGLRVRRATSEDYASKEDDWHFENDFVLRANGDSDAEEWLVVEHFKTAAQSEEGRSISRPQRLADHQSLAEQKARDVATRLHLSGVSAEALAVAAFLHDEGKRAPRWQRAFRAERDAKAYGLAVPLAKTRGPIDQRILDGYRHEFGSLPHAEANPRLLALPEDWRDLVLHLIAAHHGQARPVIETRSCDDAPPSALAERARDVALRFARLQKRWGPWGLAWWEALLRAADQQASRENDTGAEAARQMENA